MPKYEFKVVPAPRKRARFKDLKRGEDPFNKTLETLINDVSVDGWEFFRTLKLWERRRRWLFLSREVPHDTLVFRRVSKRLGRTKDVSRTPVQTPAPLSQDEAVRPRRIRRDSDPVFVRSSDQDMPADQGAVLARAIG